MRFRVLGQVAILTEHRALTVRRDRERSLLAILLMDINQVIPTSRLAESLWDGQPPEGVWITIRSHISRVRRLLTNAGAADSGVELRSAGGGYRLTGDPELVDAHHFSVLVQHAITLADQSDRVSHLRAALDLWHGRAFADVPSARLRDQLGLGLEEQRLVALEHLAFDCLALGRHMPELVDAVTADPGRERLVMLYMQTLCQGDRRTEALNVYVRTRNYLVAEYGIEPGKALRDLHRAILQDALPSVVLAQRVPQNVVPRQLPSDVAGLSDASPT